jgi:hypothetical protein
MLLANHLQTILANIFSSPLRVSEVGIKQKVANFDWNSLVFLQEFDKILYDNVVLARGIMLFLAVILVFGVRFVHTLIKTKRSKDSLSTRP